jgi:hypothetical protein
VEESDGTKGDFELGLGAWGDKGWLKQWVWRREEEKWREDVVSKGVPERG